MRVLIIDDCSDTTWLLSQLLGCRIGLDIRAVEDASRAVAMAARFHPDAICMDICMPSIDGYELSQAIRRLPGLDSVAIVAVSGYIADAGRAKAAGIDAHILKPVDFHVIGRALVAAIQARRGSTALNLSPATVQQRQEQWESR